MGFVGFCLLVGAADAAVSAPALRGWYLSLNRPPGTMPGWLYAPVWAALYPFVGAAAWLVWRRPAHRPALRLWGWQLLAGALWPPSCFALHWLASSLALSLLLIVLAVATLLTFWRLRHPAGVMLLPYLAWTCYAAYLNAGFWLLNPG